MAAVSYMLATPSCSQRQAGHGAPSPCCGSVVPLFRTSIAGKRIAHGNLPASASRRSARQACRAADTAQAEVKTLGGENGMRPEDVAEEIPKPSIKIDNEHDPFATIVCISYGDRLGELLDTVAALKNLNLNVRRAKIGQNEKGTNRHKFYITDSTTSEKILKSRRLEEIRLTILNNLLLFHPESGEELAWGIRARKADNSVDVPLGARSNRAVDTVINISHNEDSAFSVLHIKTLDRPGLLVEVVKVLKDVNVNVISAEVDTEGRIASDIFYVTYHGEPLNQSMVQLVTNALQYYLSLNDVEREESY